MANAKQCDICGKFYLVPEFEPGSFWEEDMNTSMVRIMRRKNTASIQHDIMQYHACEKCLQDVTDYILSKASQTYSEDLAE
jgi:hypothetical protein